MKYFDKLYINTPNQIEIDSPIFLEEVCIIKDTVDNEILLRNIFTNLCEQTIVAISIRIFLQDIFGEPVYCGENSSMTFLYQDITFEPGSHYGNTIPIILPNNARKAKVFIEKVVLEDGTIWNTNSDNVVNLQKQSKIESSQEFVNSIDNNTFPPTYYYVENDSCWQCTCGHPNKIDELICKKCKREKNNVKNNYIKEELDKHYHDYLDEIEKKRLLEEEKAREENEKKLLLEQKQIEKQRRKKRKIGLTIGCITGFVLACIVIIFIFLPSDKRFSAALEKCIIERDKVDELNNKADYQKLLELENEVLSYEEKWFLDERIKENCDLYISGVKDQKEALEYYDTDESKYSNLWADGYMKRSEAIVNLQAIGAIHLNKDLYGHYAAETLRNHIGRSVNGDVTFKADADYQYYLPLSVDNCTLANFKNITITAWWNSEGNDVYIDKWESGEEKDFKIPVADTIINDLSQPIHFSLEFVDYEVDSLAEN